MASTFRLFLCLLLGSGSWASGLEGVWLVADEGARVEIAPCGEKLCGRVVWLREPRTEAGEIKRDVMNRDASLRDREIVGLRILHGLRGPDSNGVWRDGRVYDPKSGKTYRCNLRLDGDDKLIMRGFLGISLFGRTTAWRRVGS